MLLQRLNPVLAAQVGRFHFGLALLLLRPDMIFGKDNDLALASGIKKSSACMRKSTKVG
jgi:hypothetical protein